jgi:hypothetical protein
MEKNALHTDSPLSIIAYFIAWFVGIIAQRSYPVNPLFTFYFQPLLAAPN